MIGGSAPRGECLPKFSVNNLNTGLYEDPFTKAKPFLGSHDGDTFFYLLAEAEKKIKHGVRLKHYPTSEYIIVAGI